MILQKKKEDFQMIKSIFFAVVIGALCSIIAYSLMCLIVLPSSPSIRIKKEIKRLLKKREELLMLGKTSEAKEIAYEVRRLESKLIDSKLKG